MKIHHETSQLNLKRTRTVRVNFLFSQAQSQGQVPFVSGVSEQNVRKIQELCSKGKKPTQIFVALSSQDHNISEDDVTRVVACLNQANNPTVASSQAWSSSQSVIQ
jgi:hypothetical protein